MLQAPPARPIKMLPMSDLTCIFTAGNAQEAYLLKNLLEQVGIEAHVDNETLATLGELPSAAKVLVPSARVEDALRLVADFDDPQRRLANAERDHADSDEYEEGETLESWPLCPRCRSPRITLCPFCETSGTEFPAADPEPGDDVAQRVLCPTCDEPFVPEFFRRCEWCEHEYPDGIAVDAPAEPREPANQRVVMLTVVLVGLGIALAAYFLLIAR